MKESLNRILKRAKKMIWLLVLIPILASGVSYFLASGDEAVTYKASTQVLLGNFENERGYTNANRLSILIPSDYFLDKINEKYNFDLDIASVQSALSVQANAVDLVTISFVGPNQDIAEETLNKVLQGLINETTERFEMKVNLVKSVLDGVEALDNNVEPATKLDVLWGAGMDNINLDNTVALENVVSSPITPENPIQRGILGFIIGAMVSVFILLLPEVFRN